MNDEDKLNPGHSSTRGVLRVVGPILAAVGLMFTIAGIGSRLNDSGARFCDACGKPLVA
jgi:hypothetical protein